MKKGETITFRASQKDKEELLKLCEELDQSQREIIIRAIMLMKEVENINKKDAIEIKMGMKRLW